MALNRRSIALTLTGLALVVGVLAVGLFAGPGASVSESAGEGSATFAVSAPGGAQPINTPFNVMVNLTVFTPGTSPTWGGYDLELAYTGGVLQAISDTRGLCSASGWSNNTLAPSIVSGCFLQSSTAIGTLETISFKCISSGTGNFNFRTRAGAVDGAGTSLYDENAVDFAMTLVDGTVACGAPPPSGTPTNTATFTVTPTPTITPSPTPSATPTVGPPPSNSCTTNVGGPPTLGIGNDCDVDINFVPFVGDGCVDTEDANPNDPWDFYSVPVPVLLVSPGALRNNVVTATDAQAVWRYFVGGAMTGTLIYEQDLNNNGVKDGWEYDRSVGVGGVLGPPNGAVTAQDAQAAFAQFKAGAFCTSGYNMTQPLCVTNVGGPPTLGNDRDCDKESPFTGFLGDGCADSEDPSPSDPWGYYTVPVPSLLADPSALRDNRVMPQDAQAVFSYFAANAHSGTTIYEQDLNHNGVRDGWEYDRTTFGAGLLGPPDGVVSAQDAQSAFAQFKAGVHCSSGYNMKNRP